MATEFTEVNDLFLTLVEDYRINLIYQTSGSAALNTYLEPWLVYSVQEFSNVCNQDLTYDLNTEKFNETLTIENINILAQMMTKYWLMKTVQDVLQMNNNIIDHDFKTFSQAQNLDSKRKYLQEKKEEISQLLQDYSYKYNKWANWNVQIFGG